MIYLGFFIRVYSVAFFFFSKMKPNIEFLCLTNNSIQMISLVFKVPSYQVITTIVAFVYAFIFQFGPFHCSIGLSRWFIPYVGAFFQHDSAGAFPAASPGESPGASPDASAAGACEACASACPPPRCRSSRRRRTCRWTWRGPWLLQSSMRWRKWAKWKKSC